MLPKKEVHKADKFIEKKIADAVTKSNDDKIIQPAKREEILNKLRRIF